MSAALARISAEIIGDVNGAIKGQGNLDSRTSAVGRESVGR
jgi:hypothetical protein